MHSMARRRGQEVGSDYLFSREEKVFMDLDYWRNMPIS